MSENDPSPPDIRRLMIEGDRIDEALRRAVREALRDHKRAGNPVCEWRDGKVVWVQPEDIPDQDEEPSHGGQGPGSRPT